jgi:hypothetical protein
MQLCKFDHTRIHTTSTERLESTHSLSERRVRAAGGAAMRALAGVAHMHYLILARCALAARSAAPVLSEGVQIGNLAVHANARSAATSLSTGCAHKWRTRSAQQSAPALSANMTRISNYSAPAAHTHTSAPRVSELLDAPTGGSREAK